MEFDSKTPKYVTSDATSFASETVRQRWPTILTSAIDDVYRATLSVEDPEKEAEGKRLVEQLGRLKYEVQHNRKLSLLDDDGFPDETAAYNKELQNLGYPSWHNVPWLFAECYLYRRINTLFQRTKRWKTYDVFARQKIDTFRSSRHAVLELASRYREIIAQLRANMPATGDVEAEKLLFFELFEICLWSNATDLSLLTNLTYEDIQKLQGAEARKASEANILINNLPAAYRLLYKARAEGKKVRRVDFVLDNAGFELYVDLFLASFLLLAELATEVILRPKSMPWFVSDVVPDDFTTLLNAISDPATFFQTPTEDEKLQDKAPAPLSEKQVNDMIFLFQDWAGRHAEGQLIIRPNRYWTAGGSFWRLPHEAGELHDDLKTSELVIFKGDLNYRKLTGDARWKPTTSFQQALGPMGKNSGINVLSLRTCKSDVVVGLPSGKDEELRKTDGGGGDSGARKWATSGKWGVVCLSEGK
ncbi:DUF89 domain-containing protein [Ophiocordyceps camponoti-floridani]|uniref:Sugar phosphate phosphatase n=1 Tax=Ophiocordyceps camponoti-floridani TaxID=2030778 RepID=A0A8H4VE53_9HYPO|nr:DUF89 domain-containing protein [Ophiocordyceps camponoti-floridani]